MKGWLADRNAAVSRSEGSMRGGGAPGLLGSAA